MPDGDSLTLLWGTWEMWCDLHDSPQAKAFGRPEGKKTRSSRDTTASVANEKNWLDKVRSIGLFDSAEGFWGLVQCTLPPSQLPHGSSYYLFRKHIAPMWEHEANRRGGKWIITFTMRPGSQSGTEARHELPSEEALTPVDAAWERLCLAAIGEMFPVPEEEICGVTVSRRKVRHSTLSPSHGNGGKSSQHAHSLAGSEWKLCLWTRTAEDAEGQLKIAHYLKELLQTVICDSGNTSRWTVLHRSCVEEGNNVAGSNMVLPFMVHRDLMQAKMLSEAGTAIPAHSLQPKYQI